MDEVDLYSQIFRATTTARRQATRGEQVVDPPPLTTNPESPLVLSKSNAQVTTLLICGRKLKHVSISNQRLDSTTITLPPTGVTHFIQNIKNLDMEPSWRRLNPECNKPLYFLVKGACRLRPHGSEFPVSRTGQHPWLRLNILSTFPGVGIIASI